MAMTDDERDKVLIELRNSVKRIESVQADHGTVQASHGEMLADYGTTLGRILSSVQGQAAARVKTDSRVADHERRIGDLERQAG